MDWLSLATGILRPIVGDFVSSQAHAQKAINLAPPALDEVLNAIHDAAKPGKLSDTQQQQIVAEGQQAVAALQAYTLLEVGLAKAGGSGSNPSAEVVQIQAGIKATREGYKQHTANIARVAAGIAPWVAPAAIPAATVPTTATGGTG